MFRVLTVGVIVVLSAYDAAAQTATKETKVEKLLSLMNSRAVVDQMFNQMKSMTASLSPPGTTPEQQKRAQEIQNRTLDLIRERLSWDRLKPQYVRIYSDTFSDEEIDGMLAFYESPVGRAMLQKMPEVMSRVMGISQEQMREVLPELQRITKEALEK